MPVFNELLYFTAVACAYTRRVTQTDDKDRSHRSVYIVWMVYETDAWYKSNGIFLSGV